MRGIVAGAIALLSAGAAACEDAEAEPPTCYNAQVLATIVGQTPSDVIDRTDEIIIRWPWFVDLDVEAVLRGMVPDERITVLTVQHTYMVADHPLRLWLRRNSAGRFNVVDFGDGERARRCTPADGLATPYIQPAPGGTYGQLKVEGERRFGRHR